MNNVNYDFLMNICMESSSQFIINDHYSKIVTTFMSPFVLNTGDMSQAQQLAAAADCSAGITVNPKRRERYFFDNPVFLHT